MRKVRSQTKIIATIGPACSSKEVLLQMIEEGVDVFRLNFSHSSKDEHQKVIDIINELNKEHNINIAILADLQGPKLRIGEVENNLIMLDDGDEINFVTNKCLGTKEQLYMSYAEFPMDVSIGDTILIDDGKIQLEVLETNNKDKVKAKVIYGGPLSSRKGVNLPNTKISLPSMTEEDISNAVFAMENNVDWIALSFVRNARDVAALKKLIKSNNSQASVIAKIEKPDALDDLDNIIDTADAIMVARGDLGVEVSFDRVPLIQKKIVNLCIKKSKPVIIATQMMESMITNFRPTRAEANDVANAVVDGADALMLSAETSVGKFPAITIRCMQQIIDWTENNGFPYYKEFVPVENTKDFLAESICYQASKSAFQITAKAIITFTHSGYTAYKISSHRPEADIFAFTNNKVIVKKMALVWGVRAFYNEEFENIDDAINFSKKALIEKELINKGDKIVHVGSTPLSEKGPTNMLRLGEV
ncbi:MAG: pyruvate kinase [Bacteroidetes bacterium]|nr:pyruvate kinase [Bacteroidota bacterium]